MAAKKRTRKTKPVEKKRQRSVSNTRWLPWIGGAVVLAAVVAALVILRSPSSNDAPSGPDVSSTPDAPSTRDPSSTPDALSAPDSAAVGKGDTEEISFERLAGRWLRPDGGYILEIRDVQSNGTLEAAYYNPRSINVSRAEWQLEGGRLRVFVVLNDINYPGSTYTLIYFPDQDRLAGVYFQALQEQNFEVFFVRQE